MTKITRNIHVLVHGFTYLYKIEKLYTILHIVTSILTPFQPFINIFMMAKILNELVQQRDLYTFLLYVGVIILGNFTFSIVLSALNQFKSVHLNQFYKSEKMLFAEKSMSMDFEKIEDPEIHALLERIRNENQNGYNMFFLNIFSGQLISSVSSIIISLILCASLFSDPNIHLFIKTIIIGAIVIVVAINYYTTKKSNQVNFEMFERLVPFNVKFNFYNDFYENYNAGKDVRLFGMGEYVTKIQREQNQYLTDLLWKTKKKALKYVFLSSISSGFLNVVIYAFVIYACMTGSIAIGDMTKYVSCMALFVGAMSGIISQFQSLFNNNKYLVNYFNYLEMPSNNNNCNLNSVNTAACPLIEFKNVSFRYPNTNSYVLKNVSFKIFNNERISIVGRNGSGKTTMIKLLCRLYVPNQGKIYLYGKDINDYDYDFYIKQLSIVFQDFKIFSFPIGQNIAVTERVDDFKVMEAARKAGLEQLINSMPNGLKTPLYKDFDEGGIELSGGEAQKVAFARAVYRDAPIVILDEPTAALDPIAENDIYLKFNDVAANKTVLFISHRLAACTFSDRICVFDNGTIIQDGSHTELIKNKKGRYYELWNAQAQYYR